jgi:hypothetical protein
MVESEIAPATREFAERLLAYETALVPALEVEDSDTCRVCEKLRLALDDLLGSGAYRFIAAEALYSAKIEAPGLASVELRPNGLIEGLSGESRLANSTLIAHLISFMEMIIGATVTLWLLDDIWPMLRSSTVDSE